MAQLNLSVLEKAVQALADGFDEFSNYPFLLSSRDGVIQRFEIAMDLSWKLMLRVLRQHYQLEEQRIRAKKDIFREAAVVELISDAEAWIGHYEARNQSSHIYDAEIANRVFERAGEFLVDARELLQRLERVT